jgi:hypothetical protein
VEGTSGGAWKLTWWPGGDDAAAGIGQRTREE